MWSLEIIVLEECSENSVVCRSDEEVATSSYILPMTRRCVGPWDVVQLTMITNLVLEDSAWV